MFYIKKQITKNNTSKKVVLNENNDVISESDEVIIKTIIEIQYYAKISVDESSFIDVFVENFDGKFIFNTEEEANVELEFIVQDEKFEKSANITYSIVSE